MYRQHDGLITGYNNMPDSDTAAQLSRWRWGDENAFCLSMPKRLQMSRPLRLLPGKRLVAQGQWQGRPVLVKCFFGGEGIREARHERDSLARVRQLGIPAPEPLLCCDSGGIAVLLTEYLTDAETLGSQLQAGADQRRIHAHMAELTVLLEKLYRAGWYQRDLHLDNFLIADEKLHFIDAGDLAALPRVGRRRRILDNLALLAAQSPLPWSPVVVDTVRELAERLSLPQRVLMRLVQRKRNRRIRKMLKKWRRESTAVGLYRGTDGDVLYDRRRFPHEGVIPGDLAEPLLSAEKVLKKGNSAHVYVWHGLVVKEYLRQDIVASVKRRLGRSRGRRSWLMGRTLLELGVPTPVPLALGLVRDRELFVQQHVSGVPFSKMLQENHPDTQAAGKAIADVLALMAGAGFSHGDSKSQNFIWTDSGIQIIDLDAVRWTGVRRLARLRHRKDLARLRRDYARYSGHVID